MTHIRQFSIQIPSLSTRGSIYVGVQLRPGGVVVMLRLDVFESGLADVPLLGIDHWLGIFMEFE